MMMSMTGHGTNRGGSTPFRIEVRSVNHRFLEANVRLPGRLSLLENDVTSLIRKRFGRGKFDLFVREEAAHRGEMEMEMTRRCFDLLKRIRKELGLKEPVTLADLLAFRGLALSQNSADTGDLSRLRGQLLKGVDEALARLKEMRQREGRHLSGWFEGRLSRFGKFLVQIERENQRERKQTDEESPIPKGDVTEEIVRLKSHVSQFQKALHSPEAIGRKLDFIAQEMVREINTIGSKIQGVRGVRHVIDFKTELEKVREQIQNVE